MTPFYDWALYNRWANERLYAACRKAQPLPAALRARLLAGLALDRLWLARLQGHKGHEPEPITAEGFAPLERARRATDDDLLDESEHADGSLVYETAHGRAREVTRAQVFTQLFQLQSQMRGRCLECLQATTTITPPPLDLILFYK
jgi:uncharacterized damage-inducible protein DinB